MSNEYRVTGDHMRMTYSTHRTAAAARRAAAALNRKWSRGGFQQPGSEARAERLAAAGWAAI